jgi:salicylate hydroxylase
MCLDYAKSVSDLPRVLAAYEQIRKPRAEWMVRKGRETAKIWHLPDGEQQRQRDKYLATMSSSVTSKWDGKNIDDPPEGNFNPLIQPYMQGFDIIDYVSTSCISNGYDRYRLILIHIDSTAVTRNTWQ